MLEEDALNGRVSSRRQGHVLIITMARADKRNAIDRHMADALDRELNLLEGDDELWAGVLEGVPQAFCAGSDLTAGGDYVTERGGEYGIIRRARSKPLIAAVEGPALGGGLEILLSCDLVVASSAAVFGLPEVAIGVVPTCGALFRAPQIFPVNLARELILTGRPIGAERAWQAGFVNQLTPPGEALEQAVLLAERICENSPTSVQACLRAIQVTLDAGTRAGWEATEDAKEALVGSEDSQEGVRSFLEKRKPVWLGR
ncbi:enoyl-CoA hydratase [Aeromicrobium sp. SMF47]|uniref:Enoyl-CoA hydratase n=1 Tax=Aeromicrobium yanjiei TaxID=2662028 RepID=A0A5Q2MKM0_9ACTN|nr:MULTISPECIES: enoyl-CoA hydratase-related protein [Aeromicrobium]MRJ77288.1 enoyl-CoA hydratase [Aeromicrobium yanjiei]MRK01655.1 enoyl-CoA hydratase [Aeromicrobium sp. S22]QGG41582.1 enoyl-CoA hydratase [Aeromicrobium yanjiei]